jgi:hypothetical protein
MERRACGAAGERAVRAGKGFSDKVSVSCPCPMGRGSMS